MAEVLDIKPVTLASYETGRVPLAAEFAQKFCAAFDVNQAWLAEEKGFIHGYIEIPIKIKPLMAQCRLFSEAYDKHIKPVTPYGYFDPTVEKDSIKLAQYGLAFGRAQETEFWTYGAFSADQLAVILAKILKEKMNTMSPQERGEFRNFILRAVGNFKIGEKTQLTLKADSLTNDGVQPVLPKLIQRLKRATEARGSKSELAKWLGVHRQLVTDWLSGKQEPGGETTLRLLNWVEQQERQK